MGADGDNLEMKWLVGLSTGWGSTCTKLDCLQNQTPLVPTNVMKALGPQLLGRAGLCSLKAEQLKPEADQIVKLSSQQKPSEMTAGMESRHSTDP